MAVRGKCAVQEIDTGALRAALKKQGAVMEYVPPAAMSASQYLR